MGTVDVLDSLRQCFLTIAVLVGPIAIVALVVGALTSVLQTITQIQDQAISFVPKMVLVGLLIVVLMPWMTEYYVEYARSVILGIPQSVLGR